MKKKVYIIGAGASKFLGVPVTSRHFELVCKYIEEKPNNFDKLKKFISKFSEKEKDVNVILNLIDFHLSNNIHLKISEKEYLSISDLKEIRKEFTVILFEHFYNEIFKSTTEENYLKYLKLVHFYERLARNELDKKTDITLNFEERENFIASYSIVNFNWDLFSLIPIIEAHGKINKENNYYLATENNPQLRIYSDFGCEYAHSDIKTGWYPHTEAVAANMNKKSVKASRKSILVKCIFPHGLMNLYRCNECGKHVMDLGDLFLNEKIVKKNFIENRKKIAFSCPFCDYIIKNEDFEILVQTNFKNKSSYFDELMINMESQVRNSDELIFIGYSLPDDDFIYRTLFKSLGNKKVKVVLYHEKCIENSFLLEENLPIEIKNCKQNEIKRYKKVFGENIRFNFIGSPKCFECNELYED